MLSGTQKSSKQKGDANQPTGQKTHVSKGSTVEKASGSADQNKISRSSQGNWKDGLKTMNRVREQVEAKDRKDNGLEPGVLAYAAQKPADKKRELKKELLR
ncbi:uncharacterized protein EAE97_007327 [Botrytis byssoidea]|uniref:Uncharacterized protein n=1 Tax=Botrytis byssoidea TaxID=139641 RepID=A0A9P5IHB2_9HELO|nr:uncharacterized protein EAE97_007327 [Botrytis byssoidea]KAF7939247.1 hypothetical protein EAE97_007327 [Botrytis byssoidea]